MKTAGLIRGRRGIELFDDSGIGSGHSLPVSSIERKAEDQFLRRYPLQPPSFDCLNRIFKGCMGGALIISHNLNPVDEGDGFGMQVGSPARYGDGQFKIVRTEYRLELNDEFLEAYGLGFASGVFPVEVRAIELVRFEKGGQVADESRTGGKVGRHLRETLGFSNRPRKDEASPLGVVRALSFWRIPGLASDESIEPSTFGSTEKKITSVRES